MDTEVTYDDYLEHHGVKGMKWGVRRSKDQLASARGARKESRSKVVKDVNSYMEENKARNYGAVIGATLLATPLTGGAVLGAQIARGSGYSRGKSAAIGIIGNIPGGILAAEVQVRKRANSG